MKCSVINCPFELGKPIIRSCGSFILCETHNILYFYSSNSPIWELIAQCPCGNPMIQEQELCVNCDSNRLEVSHEILELLKRLTSQLDNKRPIQYSEFYTFSFKSYELLKWISLTLKSGFPKQKLLTILKTDPSSHIGLLEYFSG